MDSRKEVKVGDYVMYVETGEIVCSEEGTPLRVIKIKPYTLKSVLCVFYQDGGFDYLANVQTVPSLLMELL